MGKKKPNHYCSTFSLFWMDKDGHVFLIGDDKDLELATVEMFRTACPLTIIAEPKN